MIADINNGNDVQVNSSIAGKGISIKGTGSGPFVVLARNFAPGTNAADIEAALEPVAGKIDGVNIQTFAPYVTAEIACAEKWGAEAIVAQFHGQKVRLITCAGNHWKTYLSISNRRTAEFCI